MSLVINTCAKCNVYIHKSIIFTQELNMVVRVKANTTSLKQYMVKMVTKMNFFFLSDYITMVLSLLNLVVSPLRRVFMLTLIF